ncbi:MAG TPA: FAD-binding protein [Myxococcus sp.]|nr:FAD-binding protein [Myxococcus sp.]
MSPVSPGESWSESALRALEQETSVVVHRDAAACAAANEDFGRIRQGSARGVALPRNAEEVARVVGFAAARGLKLTVRGKGLSQAGQSLARDSVLVDCSRLDRIDRPEADRVGCEAGARWREVLARAGAEGLLPRVHALNLDMSVGGLLSAGGVGATSFRYGTTTATVQALEVVTGRGELRRCGREQEPELFHAALVGQGSCGVITHATVGLRPFQPRVRSFHLLYDSHHTWLADQQLLADREDCRYLEGFCWGSARGMRVGPSGRKPFVHWLYALQVGFEYHPEAGQPEPALPSGLRAWQVLGHDEDEVLRFAQRYQPRFDLMRRVGAWQQPHPWFECFVGIPALEALLPELLQALPPWLGEGHRVLLVNGAGTPELMAVPDEPRFACLAILPMGVPRELLEETLAALGPVEERLREAGAKRYLSGHLGDMDAESWRRHLGPRHAAWGAARERFDPHRVFTSQILP